MTSTVGLVPHPGRQGAVELVATLAETLAANSVSVRVPKPDADAVGLARYGAPAHSFSEDLDFAISLGGDGTMLRTVDLVYEAGVPVLGVNLGQLGFLTEVDPAEVDEAVQRVLRGDYSIEERMVLRVKVDGGSDARGEWWALNDCLLEKAQSGRLVRLAVSIGGDFFTTYAADGMIVATPTGSTAYSFSVRGPIISPGLRCVLVTPVSPHMLFDRSLVLSAHEEVRFEVVDESSVELTLDGRTLGVLAPGDAVTCRAGEQPARLIVFSPRHFHQMLKAKFGLADR